MNKSSKQPTPNKSTKSTKDSKASKAAKTSKTPKTSAPKTESKAPEITFDSLSTEWSRTDGEGLVRILPIDGYKTGFIVMANIGPLAEQLNYFPEMTLTNEKVVVKIDDSEEQTAFTLAAAIDQAFTIPRVDADIAATE